MNLQHLLQRLKTAASALSAQQLAVLAIAFVGVVGVTIGSAYWLNTPTYGVLFTDMDADTASAVVAKLKNDKIDYLLDEGGRTVRVPASKVDELRLSLASSGMPGSGRVGFEIFDRTAFGVTDFLEHVNYRRALEGELARTIASISDVAGARVHLAMPRESLFAGQEQPAKASVVLKLRTNRPLPSSTISAITGLVAGSVEGLRPESVVLIDNYGRALARPSSASDDSSGPQLERQQALERDMSARVVALLDPILGAGHVRVNVTAQLDPGSQEETEEHWDPTPVVRSKQSMSQIAGGNAAGQGVAGARGNLPPDPKAPKPPETTLAAVSPSEHTAETTNYEVSRRTTHRLEPRGKLARLSVAVVVDDDHESVGENGKTVRRSKPRSAADIQKVHDLVAASVGLDADRGDQLTIENIAFEETPAAEDVPSVSVWRQYAPAALDVGRVVAIVAICLLALFGVLRPALNRAVGTAALPGTVARPSIVGGAPAAGLKTVEDLESEIDAELRAAANLGTARRLPVLTRRVAAMTQREPENTARLLRTWLSEEER
ncbi:MAG TPA: flagellar basal-body MS-ring/collar protein FliF [Vicinamibacterales bacterium]|nr:flagellar basal-body MS-ring/collar protein FliF [Vicinamibacterales bacterium]